MHRIARRAWTKNGTVVVVGTTAGCLVDDGARRAEATERERPRARARERTAGVARRASSRVESSRFGSIRFDRSIERTTERMGAPIERTNDRCATRDARRRAHHVARVDACAGGGRGRGGERAMKGGSTRPRVPARIEGAGRAGRAREAEGTRPNRSGVRREATDGGACD